MEPYSRVINFHVNTHTHIHTQNKQEKQTFETHTFIRDIYTYLDTSIPGDILLYICTRFYIDS